MTAPTSTGPIDPWVFQALMARVGYINNQYFMINTQFAHFFTKANQSGTMIEFTDPITMHTPKVQ